MATGRTERTDAWTAPAASGSRCCSGPEPACHASAIRPGRRCGGCERAQHDRFPSSQQRCSPDPTAGEQGGAQEEGNQERQSQGMLSEPCPAFPGHSKTNVLIFSRPPPKRRAPRTSPTLLPLLRQTPATRLKRAQRPRHPSRPSIRRISPRTKMSTQARWSPTGLLCNRPSHKAPLSPPLRHTRTPTSPPTFWTLPES